MTMCPFDVPFSPGQLDDLRRRLEQTRWLDEVSSSAWEYGFDLRFLQEICRYWRREFDWRAQVEKLSAFHHYRFVSDAPGIHFIHEKGKGPDPIPLILIHGWPGSFVEMLRIVPLLTDPAAHGGDSKDAFDIVVPSLPGFGYSDQPASGTNIFHIAKLWQELMSELGYSRFAAQGGDIGAGVSTALGLRHPDRIIGIHLNYIPASYRPYLGNGQKLTAAEDNYLNALANWYEESGAYAHIQRTRPQTPAYALNDSPAGLAAWILETFREWSDCNGDLYRRFSRDELLTNVTLYWMTQTIHSSFRIYYENKKAPLRFGPGDFVQIPCAIANFPREISAPPREWVERGYNVQHWTKMPAEDTLPR